MRRHPVALLVPAVALLTLGLLLLWCATAGAQTTTPEPPVPESKLFRGLGIAYLCLGGADAAQTTYALGTGQFRELNPVMRPLTNYPAAFGATKIGLPVFINYGTAQMWKAGPKGRSNAVAVRVIVVALQAVVVGWNAHQIRKVTR